MWLRKRPIGLLCAFIALTAPAQPARSLEPKTIKLMVPNPPGGSPDILARLLAEHIARSEGVTMLVENRPGAGNVVGTEAVARAAPDGSTLLINANPFVIDPHLRKLKYDPLTSFEPICHLVNSPNVLVVNGTSPHRTLDDLLGNARIAPGNLTVAAVGPGTAAHMTFEKLKRAAKVDMTFVPYPGNPPAISALLGDHVNVVITGYAVVADLVPSGRLRALATSSRMPLEALREVPTFVESGYQDVNVNFWMGVVAPAKTPSRIISEIGRWFTAAISAPETKEKLISQGLYPTGACGTVFAAFLRQQYNAYGEIIREANIKMR